MEPDEQEIAEIATLLREGFAAQPEPTLEKRRLEVIFGPPAKSAPPPWRMLLLSAAALAAFGLAYLMTVTPEPEPELRTSQTPEASATGWTTEAWVQPSTTDRGNFTAPTEVSVGVAAVEGENVDKGFMVFDDPARGQSRRDDEGFQFDAKLTLATRGLADSEMSSTGDPESGFVQTISLDDVAAVLQLPEGFRFAATGNLVYLPGKQGKGGLNGFGIRRDVMTVPLADGEREVLQMEVSDTSRVGGWDGVLADELQLSDTALEAKYDAAILEELTVLEEQSLRTEDRRAQYSFAALGGLHLENIELSGLDDLEGLGIDLDPDSGRLDSSDQSDLPDSTPARPPARSASDIMADQVVKRKKLNLEAEELSIEGRELYLHGDYEDGASKLIAAQLKLDAVSRTDPLVVERKAKTELLLAALYEEWAETIARDAARLAREEQFDDAVDKYRKAMNKNPQRTDEINKKIKDLNKARRFAEFRQATAPQNVDPEKPRRDYEVDRLLAQGEVFFNHRRFSDAREKFEQVLLVDPYNLEATRFLRRVNENFDQLASERREVMKAERIAEVRWKWNDPVTPLVSPDVAFAVKPQNREHEQVAVLVEPPQQSPPPPHHSLRPVNPFVMTAKDAQSTFALESESASYGVARRYIAQGYLPPRNVVRMEEFVNAFDYNYAEAPDRTFSVHAEASPAPFGKDLTLLKVGVRGKVLGRDGRKPAHLVFVVDSSGSMAREDRLPLIRQALELLVGQLGPEDRVTLISFCDRSRLLLEAQAASDKARILEAIARIECSAPTNLLAGIRTGYELAARHFRSGQVNRVILCSDGVANMGPGEADTIQQLARSKRVQGIAFTSVGVGEGAYNDNLLEQLANQGDGNYVYLDSPETARRVFVDEFTATMHTIARDAKIQVTFNPERVRRYRLIGYENRDIADGEFRNDAVDAGEIGSGQSATALYELELLPGEGDLGTVAVRHADIETGQVEEFATRLRGDLLRDLSPSEAPRFYLAACAAEFAEVLRGSEYSKGELKPVEQMLLRISQQLPMDTRVADLLQTVRAAEGLPRFGE
jgi:Ca-activated chloride channel family protein